MSVDSHFPGAPDIRMPEDPGDDAGSGIRWEGPILSGKLGVRQAFGNRSASCAAPGSRPFPI